MSDFKQIKADQAARTSVYCDSEMHIEIKDPDHAASGIPHELKLHRCDCEVTVPQTQEEFHDLDETPAPKRSHHKK